MGPLGWVGGAIVGRWQAAGLIGQNVSSWAFLRPKKRRRRGKHGEAEKEQEDGKNERKGKKKKKTTTTTTMVGVAIVAGRWIPGVCRQRRRASASLKVGGPVRNEQGGPPIQFLQALFFASDPN